MGRSAVGRAPRDARLSRSGASTVGRAAFAPSGSSSPIRRRASRAGCASRSALDCQSMPTSHAAVRHGVSWGKARRAEKAFLAEWDRTRPKRRPRHIGRDEIQRGKSAAVLDRALGSGARRGDRLAPRPHGGQLTGLLTTASTARQRAAIKAVCTDMHRPYLNAVAQVLTKAEIVFDKFHVLQHASGGARRGAPPGVLSRGRGDAGARARQTLAAAASVEDRARVEARPSCSHCSRRIGGCSKPMSCASSSIGSGPTRPATACATFCSAG